MPEYCIISNCSAVTAQIVLPKRNKYSHHASWSHLALPKANLRYRPSDVNFRPRRKAAPKCAQCHDCLPNLPKCRIAFFGHGAPLHGRNTSLKTACSRNAKCEVPVCVPVFQPSFNQDQTNFVKLRYLPNTRENSFFSRWFELSP